MRACDSPSSAWSSKVYEAIAGLLVIGSTSPGNLILRSSSSARRRIMTRCWPVYSVRQYVRELESVS